MIEPVHKWIAPYFITPIIINGIKNMEGNPDLRSSYGAEDHAHADGRGSAIMTDQGEIGSS